MPGEADRLHPYCDDMTFSGDFARDEVLRCVEPRLRALGFYLNPGKTKWLPADRRQLVTGIVVNKKCNVPSEERRALRQELHFCQKFGISGHMAASRSDGAGGPLPGSAPGPGQLPAADHAGKAGAAGSPGLADQSTAAIRRRAGDISGRKTDIVTWEKAGTSRRCSRFFGFFRRARENIPGT